MKKTNIILIVIALIFAIIGFNSYDKFVNLLFYNETNIQLVSGNLSRQFFDSLFFSGLLLSIPISFLISWNFISIKDLKRRLVSISIIGIMLTLSLLLRMIILNKEISNNIPGYKTSLTFENLLINQYLFTGLIIGTIVNLIVLNRIKVK